MQEDSQNRISADIIKCNVAVVTETKTDSKCSAILSDFSRHLKTVELQVAEDAVVILVRNVKYPAEGSNTQRFELGEITQGKNISTTFICAHMNVQRS